MQRQIASNVVVAVRVKPEVGAVSIVRTVTTRRTPAPSSSARIAPAAAASAKVTAEAEDEECERGDRGIEHHNGSRVNKLEYSSIVLEEPLSAKYEGTFKWKNSTPRKKRMRRPSPSVLTATATRIASQDERLGDSCSRMFSFDHCFDQSAKQDEIYDAIGLNALESILGGFNATLLAYGQTGSGKTYTMMGTGNVFSHDLGESEGLIPRLCKDLLCRIKAIQRVGQESISKNIQHQSSILSPSDFSEERVLSSCDVDVKVSFFEIYNERCRDLLGNDVVDESSRYNRQRSHQRGGPRSSQWLRVREHPERGAYVEGLTSYAVTDYDEVYALLVKGSKSRTICTTNINEYSSRSHTVFTITVTQWFRREGGLMEEKMGQLTLVDLAGSERAKTSGCTGMRLKEASNINRSLSTLSDVILALSSSTVSPVSLSPSNSRASSSSSFNKSGGTATTSNTPSTTQECSLRRHADVSPRFIPYRNSTLTWLLKDSLGGNNITTIIATVSPSVHHYPETLSTLRYAKRAKRITNHITRNRRVNNDTKNTIELLRSANDALRSQLASLLQETRQVSSFCGRQQLTPEVRQPTLRQNQQQPSRSRTTTKKRGTNDPMKDQLGQVRDERDRALQELKKLRMEITVEKKAMKAMMRERKHMIMERTFSDAAVREAQTSMMKHRESCDAQLTTMRREVKSVQAGANRQYHRMKKTIDDLGGQLAEAKSMIVKLQEAKQTTAKEEETSSSMQRGNAKEGREEDPGPQQTSGKSPGSPTSPGIVVSEPEKLVTEEFVHSSVYV